MGGWARAGGYMGAVVAGLQKGHQEKFQRESNKAQVDVKVAMSQRQTAQDRLDAVTASGKGKDDPDFKAAIAGLAEADKAQDKALKSLQTVYGADKGVFGHAMQVISGLGKKKGQPQAPPQAGGAPPPTTGNAPAPQANVNTGYANAMGEIGQQKYQAQQLQNQITRDESNRIAAQSKEALDQMNARGDFRNATATFSKTGDLNAAINQLSQAAMSLDPAHPNLRSLLEIEMRQWAKSIGKAPAGNDERVGELIKSLRGETGKSTPFRPPTGTQATLFEKAGVAPNKSLDEYTPAEWQRVSAEAKKEYQDTANRAAQTHDHRYQQFQAQTAPDRALLGRLEGRIGQIESIINNPMSTADDTQKAQLNQELGDARSQVIDIYQNQKAIYDQIYGSSAKGGRTPATGTDGLSPEGQKYLQGIQ